MQHHLTNQSKATKIYSTTPLQIINRLTCSVSGHQPRPSQALPLPEHLHFPQPRAARCLRCKSSVTPSGYRQRLHLTFCLQLPGWLRHRSQTANVRASNQPRRTTAARACHTWLARGSSSASWRLGEGGSCEEGVQPVALMWTRQIAPPFARRLTCYLPPPPLPPQLPQHNFRHTSTTRFATSSTTSSATSSTLRTFRLLPAVAEVAEAVAEGLESLSSAKVAKPTVGCRRKWRRQWRTWRFWRRAGAEFRHGETGSRLAKVAELGGVGAYR